MVILQYFTRVLQVQYWPSPRGPGRLCEEETSRDTKYNSQNKSPVYCQTTNFARTSKQAVRTKTEINRKSKAALPSACPPPPPHTNRLVMVQLKYIHDIYWNALSSTASRGSSSGFVFCWDILTRSTKSKKHRCGRTRSLPREKLNPPPLRTICTKI